MDMVNDFSSIAPAQHWKSSKSYEHHMEYHSVTPLALLDSKIKPAVVRVIFVIKIFSVISD